MLHPLQRTEKAVGFPVTPDIPHFALKYLTRQECNPALAQFWVPRRAMTKKTISSS